MIIKELDYLQKEEFLEHFGVKGQKWGVRNKRDASPSQKTDNHKRNLKIAKRVAVGTAAVAAVAVGGYYANKVLKAMDATKTGSPRSAMKIMKISKTSGISIERLMQGVGDSPMSVFGVTNF